MELWGFQKDNDRNLEKTGYTYDAAFLRLALLLMVIFGVLHLGNFFRHRRQFYKMLLAEAV